MKKLFLKITLLFVTSSIISYVNAQIPGCSAKLENDILTIKNNKIIQTWSWNGGDIKPLGIRNLGSGKSIEFNNKTPFFFRAENPFIKNKKIEVKELEKNIYYPAHVEVTLENEYKNMGVKQIFRIFPETEAISCDYFLRYDILSGESSVIETEATGAEHTVDAQKNDENYLASYSLPGKHWRVKTVSFKDVTDRNDNLVFETNVIPFSGVGKYEGNLMFAKDLISESGFFVLKEAPNTTSQICYPGYDFGISNKELRIPFSGFSNKAIHGAWIKGYTVTTGVCDEATNGLKALRTYLKNSINYTSDGYDMVMMNTWGDRGQDGKISEKFILAELEKAYKLGISVFQIDDGWQQGLSANSAFKGGESNWDAWSPESWLPNKERFPNGLDKVLESAKAKNIELGLWFNPSKVNSYASWENDANIIINLNRSTGIKYFKIDGVAIPDKLAEENFTRFLNKVKDETGGEVFFNLDLTAGVRGGYFSYRYAGNLFLENRYTDWGKYFPFHTLRNIWMLSEYFPPEMLQIEFLNKWRNAKKYDANDIFAPGNYEFEYLFSNTMAAQPLAWFESTGLPDEAFTTAKTIKKYREVQEELHAGITLPIGEEPSGRSWTGFQSMQKDKGYFIVYREYTAKDAKEVKTYLEEGQQIKLTRILGDGKDFKTLVSSEGRVRFVLQEQNSFVLYKYEVVR